MTATGTRFRGHRGAESAALALSALGTLALALGAAIDRRQLFFSYLVAYAYAVSVATGALIFLMTCHAMRAGWPVAVRRFVEAIVAVFPWLAVLFVPLCLGLGFLYPWLHLDRFADLEERALVARKTPYLNVPAFLGRAAVFFAIWMVTAWLLRRWSLAKDADPEAEVEPKLHRLSAVALPAVALATSFAAFDWLMSLTPLWFSTMYPVYFFAGGFLSALATLTILTYLARESGLLPAINESHFYALGRLLLAFTIFWAYAAFFQFMFIWIGNRPDEVDYYLLRVRGGWRVMTAVLVVGQFVVPFCLLLNYRLKRRGRALATIAAFILAAHYVDVHWLVAPTARADRFPLHWLDLAALLAVGGSSVAVALFGLRGHHVVPIHDPKLPEALRYQSS
jgi:hypothetical protein